MEDLLMAVDSAIVYLVERQKDDLEKSLQSIMQISTNVFPFIISLYMKEEMRDRANEATEWVALYEELIGMNGVNDGFVLYDLLYHKLYRRLEDFMTLVRERGISVG